MILTNNEWQYNTRHAPDCNRKDAMNKRVKVAFACHSLALLMTAASGVIYLFRTQFMPYHAVALGKSWADIDKAF
jgi:hypothetical protein